MFMSEFTPLSVLEGNCVLLERQVLRGLQAMVFENEESVRLRTEGSTPGALVFTNLVITPTVVVQEFKF